MAHERVQDFESSHGEDLALWDGVNAVLHHRTPGLDGSAGGLEAALYPGGTTAHLELRDALPATDLATRTLRYTSLVRVDGVVAPAFEVQYSEEDGDTWVTAGHPFDMMPVHSSVVSNSGKALTVECLPLPVVMHDEVSLPTGKIRVRFYLSARSGQARSIVLDDLQIIARGNANKPHPGAIPGSTEPGVDYPGPEVCVVPAERF